MKERNETLLAFYISSSQKWGGEEGSLIRAEEERRKSVIARNHITSANIDRRMKLR